MPSGTRNLELTSAKSLFNSEADDARSSRCDSLVIEATVMLIVRFVAKAAPAVQRLAGELTHGIQLSLPAIGVAGAPR